VVAGELLDLLGLLVDNVGSVGKMMVNEFLVGLVNQGTEEKNRCRDECQTPQWDDLDEVVGEESTEESLEIISRFWQREQGAYSAGSKDVLSKDDALSLDNKEVDELVNITDERVKSLFGDCVVFSGSELRGQTLAQEKLPTSLSQDGNPQSHPCQLECVSKNIKISSSEDEKDDGSVCNAGGTGILPRQQAREERVVMCELLTSSCGCGRSCARGSEVRKFGGGLCVLLLDVLCNRACRVIVSSGLMRCSQISFRNEPLVTLWVMGWLATALAAEDASGRAC
jgi:hypothetical protein